MKLELSWTVDVRHHGKGKILFSWHPLGTSVASTGDSRVVHIFDSEGRISEQIVPPSPSTCLALEWEPTSGQILAIIQAFSPTICLWHPETKELKELDTNFKELTLFKWLAQVSSIIFREMLISLLHS